MLYRIHSSSLFIQSKIVFKNIGARLRNLGGYHTPVSPGTEFLPAVNINLEVQGIGLREMVHQQGILHPVVHLMVFSPDQKYVLLQCRSPKKDFSNNKLGSSVGGHIPGHYTQIGTVITEAGARIALEKETREETGITGLNYSFSGTYPYESHPVSAPTLSNRPQSFFRNQEIVFMFSASHPVQRLTPQLDEVKWLGWFSVDGISSLAQKNPDLFSGHLLDDLKYLGLLPK
jgi:8-oxo-dGTP pyrophosphatase MutT (NUDIX family)